MLREFQSFSDSEEQGAFRSRDQVSYFQGRTTLYSVSLFFCTSLLIQSVLNGSRQIPN